MSPLLFTLGFLEMFAVLSLLFEELADAQPGPAEARAGAGAGAARGQDSGSDLHRGLRLGPAGHPEFQEAHEREW